MSLLLLPKIKATFVSTWLVNELPKACSREYNHAIVLTDLTGCHLSVLI